MSNEDVLSRETKTENSSWNFSEGGGAMYPLQECSTHLGDAPMSVAGLPVFSGPRVINSRQCIAPTGDLWSSVLHDGGYNREEEDEMVRLIT